MKQVRMKRALSLPLPQSLYLLQLIDFGTLTILLIYNTGVEDKASKRN